MELKCNNCRNLSEASFCVYLKEYLPNGFAKLHLGGAIGEHHGKIRHPGKCGKGYQAKQQTELEIAINIESEVTSIASAGRTKTHTENP